MQNNPDPPRAYPDLPGVHTDPALERLITDLDTLYTAAEPAPAFSAMLRRRIDGCSTAQAEGALHTDGVRSSGATAPGASALWFRPLRRRPLIALAAAAVLGAVAVTGILSFGGGTQPVSAAEILDRAVEAANPAAAGTRTYHRTGTSKFEKNGVTFDNTEEAWYGGNGRARIETQARNATGGLVENSGFVISGERQTIFRTVDGKTYVTITDLGSDVGPAIDQKFSPGRNANALSDVIAQYRDNGCSNVQQQADTRVANRAAYVIALTPSTTGGCNAANERGGQNYVVRTVIAVDKETFFPLRIQALNAGGAVLRNWETTSIEYNITIPDSTFTYTPPPGAIVEVTPAGKPGPDSKEPTEADKEKLRQQKPRIEQEQQQRAATPTPTPRP